MNEGKTIYDIFEECGKGYKFKKIDTYFEFEEGKLLASYKLSTNDINFNEEIENEIDKINWCHYDVIIESVDENGKQWKIIHG